MMGNGKLTEDCRLRTADWLVILPGFEPGTHDLKGRCSTC